MKINLEWKKSPGSETTHEAKCGPLLFQRRKVEFQAKPFVLVVYVERFVGPEMASAGHVPVLSMEFGEADEASEWASGWAGMFLARLNAGAKAKGDRKKTRVGVWMNK